MMRRAVFSAALLGMLVAQPALTVTDAERGRALYEARNYQPARQIFEGILAGHDADETALFFLGKIQLDYADLDGAREYLEKLVELRPDSASYQLALGTVYGEKARTSGFILSKKKWAGRWKERLEIAFELDPQNLDARNWIASYLLNAPGIGGGDKDRGTKIARQTIEIDEVFGRLLLGYAHRKSGNLDLAIREYLTVLRLEPENGRAQIGLGYCYLQQEDFEKAQQSFSRAIEVTPEDTDAHESMAYFWSQRGSEETVAEYQESALQQNPLLSDTRYDLARYYQDQKATARAVHHYEQLLALTPKHHKAGKAKKRLRKLKNPRAR